MSLARRRVVIVCFCAAALAAVGCADGSVSRQSQRQSCRLESGGDRGELSPQRPSREAERSM
jgi:hypothetical protein